MLARSGDPEHADNLGLLQLLVKDAPRTEKTAAAARDACSGSAELLNGEA